jgi:3-hydroxybutyryl-CoA dehydrogenase
MDIKHIFVIGAGTMGNGIAQVGATSGYRVTCMDVVPAALEKAKTTIGKSTAKLLEKGVLTAEQKSNANAINFVSNMDTIGEADIVIEAATENPELKFKIFKEMDEKAREGVILASNTSSISITKIAGSTSRPDKVIGMHFMNPVPIMKLVEVIRGIATSDETFELTWALSEKFGKTPAQANDFPGFIANRILMPMINEAIFTLYHGVGKREDIDTVMKLGMNHPMGPLALADLIGLDTCLAIMETLYDGFKDSKYRPCPLLRKYVEAGWLGKKTGRGFYEYN